MNKSFLLLSYPDRDWYRKQSNNDRNIYKGHNGKVFIYIFLVSYFILMIGELYGVKSRFHRHGLFLFRRESLISDVEGLSTLAERLITDSLRLPLAEDELFAALLDNLSVFPVGKFPALNRLSHD